MNFLDIIFIAVGLSMDAFAVAITSWFVNKKLDLNQAFKIALYFWGFQAIMPIVWWLAWVSFKDYVSSFDHWIAFVLLSIIWWKMIIESFKDEESSKKLDYTKHKVLLTLAIATSIDALAVWISLSFLNIPLFIPALIIWIITFIFSFVWVYLWKKFWHLFWNKIEIVWWIILIWIWVKILIEHTM